MGIALTANQDLSTMLLQQDRSSYFLSLKDIGGKELIFGKTSSNISFSICAVLNILTKKMFVSSSEPGQFLQVPYTFFSYKKKACKTMRQAEEAKNLRKSQENLKSPVPKFIFSTCQKSILAHCL